MSRTRMLTKGGPAANHISMHFTHWALSMATGQCNFACVQNNRQSKISSEAMTIVEEKKLYPPPPPFPYLCLTNRCTGLVLVACVAQLEGVIAVDLNPLARVVHPQTPS